jgi:hypothetical protein
MKSKENDMKNNFQNPAQPRVYTLREWRVRQITRAALAVIGVAALIAAVVTVARSIRLRPAESPELPADVPTVGIGREADGTEIGLFLSPACRAEKIETALRISTYAEGDSPVPEWYRPEEPMAVEWVASFEKVPASFQQEVVKTVDELPETVDDAVDGATDSYVGDTNVPIKPHPPVGIDPGGIDYNIEPEVIPDYLLDVPLDRYLQEYIHRLCEESGLPYTLAIAVIEQESHYTPWIISDSDDWGLMQINSICHEWLSRELGVTDFLDAWQNARAGIWLLADYYARYGYASGALMCYNMGEPRAQVLFDQGIYATDYSERVIGIQYRLETEGR